LNPWDNPDPARSGTAGVEAQGVPLSPLLGDRRKLRRDRRENKENTA